MTENYAVLWIRNYLFRIQIQLWIIRVPDPGKRSGSMRIRIRIHNTEIIYKLSVKMFTFDIKFN